MAEPSFLQETAAETAEFEAVRDGQDVPETPSPAPAPEPKAADPAPAPAEPKAEEPAKAPEPTKPDERPKFVPHAALHEERLKRQALEKELADLRAGRQQPTEETPKAAEIDPETDPIGALKQIREFQEQQRQQGIRQQAEQEFTARVQTHEADFAAATPDYADAITHLRKSRAAEIIAIAKATGTPLTQEGLGAQLRHEALQLADTAFRTGKNPGELFYAVAQAKGYKMKAAEAAKPPAPEPVDTKQATETIERLTRGQRAAKVSGGEPPDGGGEVSLESLAKLNGAAFDAAFEKFSKSQRMN